MRILLINPPHKLKISRSSRWPEYTKSGTLYYPTWLAYATGILLKKGHDAILIDAIANEWNFNTTIDEIEKIEAELVVVDSSTPSIHNDIIFINRLKKQFPKIKTILVGTHPSALPNETFKLSKNIDFIARHEYDYTIPDLIDTIEGKKDLKNVLGISYKTGGKIIHNPDRPPIQNLDELPFVSKIYKKFLDIERYRYALARHPMIQVMSSRGCPNMCTFCLIPQTFMGRVFRARSPENFVDELEWIKKNLPEIKEIFIEDDTFTVDKQRVLKICELIEERSLDITWSVNARADIPYNILQKMKNAGCRMLIIGYESGNNEILKNIKKGMSVEMATKFTIAAKNAGLKIFGCFMIGLPGETKETIEQTFQFAKKLNPDMAFFQQAVPFPGTEFYDWCKKNGYLITEDYSKWLDKNGQLDYLVSYPNLTNEELRGIRDKLTVRFYTSPRHIWQTVTHNLNLEELSRLAVGAKDYLSYLIRKNVSK